MPCCFPFLYHFTKGIADAPPSVDARGARAANVLAGWIFDSKVPGISRPHRAVFANFDRDFETHDLRVRLGKWYRLPENVEAAFDFILSVHYRPS